LEDTKREVDRLRITFNQKDEENRKLNESLESTLQKLEESRQVLKKNEEGMRKSYSVFPLVGNAFWC